MYMNIKISLMSASVVNVLNYKQHSSSDEILPNFQTKKLSTYLY